MSHIASLGLSLFLVTTLFASAQNSNDHLVVDGFYPLTSDESYECVTINAPNGILSTNGFELNVKAAGGLKCHGTILVNAGSVILSGGGTSTIDGTVLLEDLSPFHSSVQIKGANCVLSGSGYLIGETDWVKVEIEGFRTLTSGINIEGALSICPGDLPAKFVNQESVRASAGKIVLEPLLVVSDLSGARWGASNASSRLWFSCVAPFLKGDFHLDHGGRIQIDNIAVFTTGTVFYETGVIDIAGFVPFIFGADGCANPPTPLVSPLWGPTTRVLSCPP